MTFPREHTIAGGDWKNRQDPMTMDPTASNMLWTVEDGAWSTVYDDPDSATHVLGNHRNVIMNRIWTHWPHPWMLILESTDRKLVDILVETHNDQVRKLWEKVTKHDD